MPNKPSLEHMHHLQSLFLRAQAKSGLTQQELLQLFFYDGVVKALSIMVAHDSDKAWEKNNELLSIIKAKYEEYA